MMVYTVIQCLFLRKNAIPFLKEQKKQQQKKPSLLAAERCRRKALSEKLQAYIFLSLGLTVVLFHFVL